MINNIIKPGIMAAVTASVLLLANPASAAIVTYAGADDGAAIGTVGSFTNSDAAAANFAAAAGTLNTITFESLSTGYNANFAAAPGVNVALTGADYGIGFSGIQNTASSNVYGFNVTTGGQNWLGFPNGTATFSFTDPVSAFGFYLTGVQTVFTSQILITFSDGQSQSLDAPVNVNGGAAYFGFTDAGAQISSITISNISNDAWGIDNVSYAAATVPEPATLGLLGLGFAGFAFARRKRAN